VFFVGFFCLFFFYDELLMSPLNALLGRIWHPQDLMHKERLVTWTHQSITLQPPLDLRSSHAVSVVT